MELTNYAVELGTFTYGRAMECVPAEPPSVEQIRGLQAAMAQGIADGALQEAECPVRHFFAPGMYTRECTIPAGSVVVGKQHRHVHPVFLMQGSVQINTDRGLETIHAPHIWISQENAKRVLHTLTDCVFATVHLNASDTQDLDVIEAEHIVPEGLLAHGETAALFTDELQEMYA